MAEKKRDYKKEYQEYHSKPENRRDNDLRKKARREMEKKGKVKKGDGKHVDHKIPLKAGGSGATSNLRVVDAKTNQGFARDRNNKPKVK